MLSIEVECKKTLSMQNWNLCHAHANTDERVTGLACTVLQIVKLLAVYITPYQMKQKQFLPNNMTQI